MLGFSAKFHQSAEIKRFLRDLGTDGIQEPAARGLTEHAHEQKRQSVVRIAAYTGVPAKRVRSKTVVKSARPGPAMTATVTTADQAISLAQYGRPVWRRDRSPGWRGGSVSSMSGVEATGWNVRRQFPGTFLAKGLVLRRTGDDRYPLKVLSMAVLANELAKPSRPNVPAAEKFAQMDLEKRVTRHIVRSLGT